MSSDLFVYENSLFTDSFSQFADPQPQFPFDIFEEIQESAINLVPNNGSATIDDQFAAALMSTSPPSDELENLSLSQFVKTEDFHMNFDPLLPQSLDSEHETAVRFMQRSFSSNSFEHHKQGYSFQPQFNSLWESHSHQNLQNPILDSPDSAGCGGHMRRVCSTGDLQGRNAVSGEQTLMGEGGSFRVGKYSAEERKERIDRYRAKRTQRNFNKTIKYACRKTLADNRPRIRGRFARNDEVGEVFKASRYEDEDDIWIDGLHEEDDEATVPRWTFLNGNFSYS